MKNQHYCFLNYYYYYYIVNMNILYIIFLILRKVNNFTFVSCVNILYGFVLPFINIQVKFQFTIPTTNKREHLIYQLNQFVLPVSGELPLNLAHGYLNIINNKSLQNARDNHLCHISPINTYIIIRINRILMFPVENVIKFYQL